MEDLHRLSVALLDGRTVDELSWVLTMVGGPIVGAANAAMAVVVRDAGMLRVHQGPAHTVGTADIRLVALAEPTPLTDVVRSRRPLLIRSAAEFALAYPKIARRLQPGEIEAMAAYPLVHRGEVQGSCFFRFTEAVDLGGERGEMIERIVEVLEHALAGVEERESLVAHMERLDRSNRDLDDFAVVVAHDLSAPVRRIGSFLQLLMRDVGACTPDATRFAGIIEAQTRHLDQLLRDLLGYSQVVASPGRREPVDLGVVVGEVLDGISDELDASIDVGPLPVVDVERSLIRQVITNIVDNANKYRHPGRSLKLHIYGALEAGEGDWWRISVADNGIGIHPDHANGAFAMFVRLDNTNDQPGTGVGLAFAKRVIERHGGQIGVESTVGEGSTFWFTLPGVTTADIL